MMAKSISVSVYLSDEGASALEFYVEQLSATVPLKVTKSNAIEGLVIKAAKEAGWTFVSDSDKAKPKRK